MSAFGPISQHLESELRDQARQHGIVVWLDQPGAFSSFADALAARASDGAFPFPVRRFRGSYLALLRELNGTEDAIGKLPLVLHVPGRSPEDLVRTPLLELLRAGKPFTQDLPELVKSAAHGRASLSQLDAFLSAGAPTLDGADAWLDRLERGGPATGPDLSALSAEALVDAVMDGGTLTAQLGDDTVVHAVWARAERVLGLDAKAAAAQVHPGKTTAAERASNVALELAGIALAVEFVHDLRRAPRDAWLAPLGNLPAPMVRSAQELARHLRRRYPDRYAIWAHEMEGRLPNEVEQATAADLGHVDTFRFEDRKVMAAAIGALERGEFAQALEWARARREGESFWCARDGQRRLAWRHVELGAELGVQLIGQAQLLAKVGSHREALERYVQGGHQVDTAHRILEQARQQQPVLEVDEFDDLRRALDALRHRYRAWADAQATAFNSLCQQHGFLPEAALQQRTLFDDVVRPLADEGGTTAYFMVDALRYEMAARLREALSQTHVDVNLQARFAELPTVTEVGMNVLAPVTSAGKLAPQVGDNAKVLGFRAGQARVGTPDDRQKTIHERVGGKTCPKLSLEEVLSRDVTSLRRAVAEARLVIVHAEGIDKAGEKGVGLMVFEQQLQDLRSATLQLSQAGVRRFVFTADHGFLLHDSLTRAPIDHGAKTDPKRRHVISFDHLARDQEVAVSSAELGYDVERPFWVLLPKTAAPFNIGDKAKDFVHGGNSLQERVIPVLTLRQRYAPGDALLSFELRANAAQAVARMQCIEAELSAHSTQTSLSFTAAEQVEVVLEPEAGTFATLQVCDVHQAELRGNAVLAKPGQAFRIYFKLTAGSASRVRVRLRSPASSPLFKALELEERFDVEVEKAIAPPPKALASSAAWLDELPAGGVRDVFRHLSQHRTVTEAEATTMLGGGRQFRKFSADFEAYARRAPFTIRIEHVSGQKTYVKGKG